MVSIDVNKLPTILSMDFQGICVDKFRDEADLNLKEHKVLLFPDNTKPYSCNICAKNFPTVRIRRNHIKKVHENKGKYTCSFCNKVVFDHNQLNLHLRRHTGEKPFPCSMCELSFGNNRLRDYHFVLVHSPEKAYKCTECEKIFASKFHLKSHFLVHKSEHNFNCSICQKGFSRRSSKVQHEITHREISKSCQYNTCDNDFKTNESILSYSNTSSAETRPIYNCLECTKTFISEAGLRHHKFVHLGKNYSCEICCAEFLSPNNLSQHIKRMHTVRELKFKCEFCTKRYQFHSELAKHTKTHINKKPFACNKCPSTSITKYFKTKTELSRHSITHSNARRSYSCDECEKILLTASGLREHKFTHLNKKYSCKICSAKFSTPSYLSKHVQRKHSVRKQRFACRFCAKAFHFNSELTKHLKIHNKEKHKCKLCYSEFSNPEYLTQHTKRMHTVRELKFKCIFCAKRFHVISNLTKHLKIHIKEKHSCKICKAEFSNAEYLNEHTKRMHTVRVNKFRCLFCAKRFYSNSNFTKHLKIHIKEKYSCKICKTEFSTPEYLGKHTKRVHTVRELRFGCQFCAKRFHFNCELVKHVKIHTSIKGNPVASSKCASTFTLQSGGPLPPDRQNIPILTENKVLEDPESLFERLRNKFNCAPCVVILEKLN